MDIQDFLVICYYDGNCMKWVGMRVFWFCLFGLIVIDGIDCEFNDFIVKGFLMDIFTKIIDYELFCR